MRILGIDPGSRATGYGVVEVSSGRTLYVTAGVIRLQDPTLAVRLRVIFEEVRSVIETHRPEVVAIEQVFMHRNAGSALKLGQARGAAICAAVTLDLTVHEYAPRTVKQAVVGAGGADKDQVQHMVRVLLGLQQEIAEDAADALAVALCHSHTRATLMRLPSARGVRGGRWR